MRKQKQIDVSGISDSGCRALAAAILIDAIRQYAVCTIRDKEKDYVYQSQSSVAKETYELEWFFKSDLYVMYAGGVDLNLSGMDIQKMIKKDPYKFSRRLKEKEKRKWRDSRTK